MNEIQGKEKLDKIRNIAEKIAKKHLNKELTGQNILALIKDIEKNIELEVPDFRSIISCIEFKVEPKDQKGIIHIIYHHEITMRYGIKELIITIT